MHLTAEITVIDGGRRGGSPALEEEGKKNTGRLTDSAPKPSQERPSGARATADTAQPVLPVQHAPEKRPRAMANRELLVASPRR